MPVVLEKRGAGGVCEGELHHSKSTNGVSNWELRRAGGRGGDEGLARTRGGYLRKTWRNRVKNEVRPGA
jgi:hypothetical protein